MTLPENTSASFNNADAILNFWLADGLRTGWPAQDMNPVWFGGGLALDQEIKARFGADVVLAVQGGLQDWELQLHSRLRGNIPHRRSAFCAVSIKKSRATWRNLFLNPLALGAAY